MFLSHFTDYISFLVNEWLFAHVGKYISPIICLKKKHFSYYTPIRNVFSVYYLYIDIYTFFRLLLIRFCKLQLRSLHVVMEEIEILTCLCEGGNSTLGFLTCPLGRTQLCSCENLESEQGVSCVDLKA